MAKADQRRRLRFELVKVSCTVSQSGSCPMTKKKLLSGGWQMAGASPIPRPILRVSGRLKRRHPTPSAEDCAWPSRCEGRRQPGLQLQPVHPALNPSVRPGGTGQ